MSTQNEDLKGYMSCKEKNMYISSTAVPVKSKLTISLTHNSNLKDFKYWVSRLKIRWKSGIVLNDTTANFHGCPEN